MYVISKYLGYQFYIKILPEQTVSLVDLFPTTKSIKVLLEHIR